MWQCARRHLQAGRAPAALSSRCAPHHCATESKTSPTPASAASCSRRNGAEKFGARACGRGPGASVRAEEARPLARAAGLLQMGHIGAVPNRVRFRACPPSRRGNRVPAVGAGEGECARARGGWRAHAQAPQGAAARGTQLQCKARDVLMRLDVQLVKTNPLKPEQCRRKRWKRGRPGGRHAPLGPAPRCQRASWGVYACAAHAFVLLDDTKAAGHGAQAR